jgi:hypothetical protein
MNEYRREVGARVRLLACPHDGISKTRQWIGKFAASEEQPKFVMLDDDLGFLIRRDQEDLTKFQLRGPTKGEVRKMFRDVFAALEDDVGMVGVSGREGNNRVHERYVMNTRIIRFLGFQTEVFNAMEHGRVKVMEDFDITLQMLRQGYQNLCFYVYAQGQAQTQAPGGCSDYRTHENHEASATMLAELHPGFVRLRDKKNKSGGEFGTRKEVTISWKKAYASSQEATDEGDKGTQRS